MILKPPPIASGGVPSLTSLCIRVLAIHATDALPIDVRRRYNTALHDVLDAAHNPAYWLALVQLYDDLPPHLATLTLPLSDKHLPLLQRIQPSPLFSLITVLDLPRCPHLTDNSIVKLSPLHSLVALDASATSLSSYAIKALAGTLLWFDDGPRRRGPWPLRILRLRFCDKIDHTVYSHLENFPLLTAIDLRGTHCRPPTDSSFQSCLTKPELFHPEPLVAAVEALEGPHLYTSESIFKLVIDTLHHPQIHTPRESKAFADTYTFQAPNSKRKLHLERAEHEIIDKKTRQNHPSAKSIHPQPITSLPAPALNITPTRITSETHPSQFYGSHRSRSPPGDKYDLVNNYNAKTYYKWVHLEVVARPPDQRDMYLTLYRTPPPWSVLEERSTFLLNKTKDRPSVEDKYVARPTPANRAQKTFQINQSRIDALRESANARRRSGVGCTVSSSLAAGDCEPPVPLQRRKNPFRRHSMPNDAPSVGVPDSTSGMKPLVPISAVEVPLLPSNSKADVKPSTVSNTTPKATPSASPASVSRSMSKPRPGAFQSTWSGHEQKTRLGKASSSVDGIVVSKKVRLDYESAFDNPKKRRSANEDSKKVKKGFDWNSWSLGS